MRMPRLVFSLFLLAFVAACASPGRYPPPQKYPAPQRQPQPEQRGAGASPQPWPAPPSSPAGDGGYGGYGGYGDVITHEPEAEPVPTGPPPPRTVQEASGPAVVALLNSADQKARAGESAQAEAYVERAVAVEPRNPFIFQRLAALRLDQGEAEQAEAMARKSNSLAGDNPYVKAGNWKLIAEARRMRGDKAGAAEAATRSEVYLSQTRGR